LVAVSLTGPNDPPLGPAREKVKALLARPVMALPPPSATVRVARSVPAETTVGAAKWTVDTVELTAPGTTVTVGAWVMGLPMTVTVNVLAVPTVLGVKTDV
jgi:hypothetical protein